MRKIKNEIVIVGSIVLLIGAYGIGLSIRNIRFIMAENRIREYAAQAKLHSDDKPAPTPAPEIRYVTKEPVRKSENKPSEIIEERRVVEPEVAWEEPVVWQEPEVVWEEPQTARREPEVAWNNNNQWDDWGNNLTEQQRSRLQQGMASMWQRMQNLSPEEAQAERSRAMQMFQSWQGMSDQQRQQVMQGMRQQFQQWLDSDQIELPVFSWD